jgi:hypothetical protein
MVSIRPEHTLGTGDKWHVVGHKYDKVREVQVYQPLASATICPDGTSRSVSDSAHLVCVYSLESGGVIEK